MARPIYFFTKNDPYYELSNFAALGFEDGDVYWPTAEHYFQAMKFDDLDYREIIRKAKSPKYAKTLGQSRKHPIRQDWDIVRDSVMLHALRLKFASPVAREVLLSTKRRPLIENSPYDSYWGCGANGKGKNRLGALLVQVRSEIHEEE